MGKLSGKCIQNKLIPLIWPSTVFKRTNIISVLGMPPSW
jgi:hypothetical protein